jgi:predicted dehydrogenase
MARGLGIGVVGTGWVAGAHLDTFKQIAGCKVVAVCSRDVRKAAEKIERHGVAAQPYGDLKKFLKHPGLDVVVICTPHPNHPAETIAAARAGKHVVIEKPVALNRADLRRMVAAVNAAQVCTSVCFELRWIGSLRNSKAIIEQGLIGRPFYGEASYFHGIGPWYGQWGWNIQKRMGGSALLTAGCHALDSLVWLMGSPVVEVAAMANTSRANKLKYEYDPNSVALLRFASGAIGKVATSIECRQPYLFPVLIQGDAGSIWNDNLWTTRMPSMRSWARIPAGLPDSGDVHDHPYKGQLEYFVQCVRSGRRPHNDLHNAAHIHEIMFAIDRAIRSNTTVKVPPTPGAKTLFGPMDRPDPLTIHA